MEEDHNTITSFFSFTTPDPLLPARDAPVIDDFLTAHVQNHSTAPAHASASPVDSGIPVAPTQTKPKPAAAAALDEQIHPLIRSRRLDTPEEIAAWIAERKAKYPTAANSRAKTPQAAAKRKLSAATEDPPPATTANPLGMLMQYAGESDTSEPDSDDDEGPELASTKPPPVRAPFRPSGLAPGEDRRKLQVCKYFAKGSCHKGKTCPFSHPESLNKLQESTTPSNAATEAKQAKGGSSSSLLAMLMAKDIDRENYRIFQCIQYICDRNFLGTPSQIELLYQ
ncbi:hypothetical protein H4S07_004281 [Coemansia furcata]|uniref:Uncharacterized protein n=1 Tax=Coemansia furcata TaxID=417177 RepID=A0ACC1L9N3_9FUNG|nr:hypothetical protein H4S07_004281 [Coemansia furcata]